MTPITYMKFDKEIIARSLRMENQVQPEKVWKVCLISYFYFLLIVLQQLNFETKLDYLKKAGMVLVFHNYGMTPLAKIKIINKCLNKQKICLNKKNLYKKLHQYSPKVGLNAKEIKSVRAIAKSARCEWVQNKSMCNDCILYCNFLYQHWEHYTCVIWVMSLLRLFYEMVLLSCGWRTT